MVSSKSWLVRRMFVVATITAALSLGRSQLCASPTVSFTQDIRPILQSRCTRCHGEQTRKADLNLSSARGIRKGGESGSLVEAGKPAESRLFEVVHSGEMPPDGEGDPLPAKEIALIRRWIVLGADMDTNLPHPSKQLDQHDVLPILLLRCASCHGRQTQEAGLDLRTRATMLDGGMSGPAIVPGDPDASLIIQKIRAELMPPRSKLASHSVKPVTDSELNRLDEWIRVGAPEIDRPPDIASTEPDPLVTDEDRSFWSFQPPSRPDLPSIGGSAVNPIDHFILHRLERAGLQASQPAAQHVLVRRAYFDLLGLPPTPDEVTAFLSDGRPQSHERLVERLLASPQYGERWAQYWLDVVGYSDSEGVQHSDPVRPQAYRYRDYVIRAFNDDKPYDRFLLEQIAGDELADYENAKVISNAMYDNLVATGFLRMTSDGTFAGITGFVPNRIDVIDDQLRVLSSSVMGISVRCARCHSHKFDPIPQRDYYRLVALLKPAMDEHDWLKPVTGGAGNSRGRFRYLSHVTTVEREKWERHQTDVNQRIGELKSRLEQNKNDENLIKTTEETIRQLESTRSPEPMIRALWDRGDPSPTYILRRGDYLQPTRLVGAGVPSVLTDGQTPFQATLPWPHAKKTGNRLALVKWLVQPNHPLTARVLVNRIWRHHFGRGIVETLDDFGHAGARPSHPELLDWLAVEFVRRDWSIKHLHRLIMTSATYRQTTRGSMEQRQLDPENRLLSHMSLRRMEAEVVRDTILALALQLDPTPFGPADGLQARADGLVISAPRTAGRRRSIYIQKRRTQRLTILDSFDRPAMSPNCVDRPLSIVAPQALFLMNNKMVHDCSQSMAGRVLRDAGNDREQVRNMYLLTVGRPALGEEEDMAVDALRQLRSKWCDELAGDATFENLEREAHRRALGNLCHALLNSAAFMYVD